MTSVGGTAAMAVVSLAVLLPVKALPSPPPDTVALLMTVAGALAETFTVRRIGGKVAPDASESERVHVSVANAHDHSVPAIAVAVKDGGSASTTETTPDVAETTPGRIDGAFDTMML